MRFRRLQSLETTANTAWPALKVRENETWTFRAAAGYTRRSNCVLPPWTRPAEDLRQSLEHALKFARAKGFATTIKIVSFLPYREELVAALAGLNARENGASYMLVAPLPASEPKANGKFTDQPTGTWMETFVRWSEIPAEETAGMRGILERIPVPRAFFTGGATNRPKALAMGVVTDGNLGLFDFVVDPDRRRAGHGSALLARVLDWGATQDARRAYLQVLRANAPALRLYERFGFRPAYEYAYYSICDE